jgi:hypothetical protein
MPVNGSAAQTLVLRMHAHGHSFAAIGRALGRDSSAISQIASGKRGPNYGRSYTPALAHAEQELKNQAAGAPAHPIVQPARRMKGKGRTQEPARVRQPISRGVGKQWGVSNVKRQATRSGARSLTAKLGDASAKGRQAGVSVTVSPAVKGGYKQTGTGKGAPGDKEIKADLDQAFEEQLDAAGGNFTEALTAWLQVTQRVESIEPGQVHAIELRTWTP